MESINHEDNNMEIIAEFNTHHEKSKCIDTTERINISEEDKNNKMDDYL